MNRRSLRRGFTLAEILIAMVLIGIIGAMFTRVLIVQTRYFDQQNAKRNARSVSRSAMNVILSDLRMVQDSLGVDSLTDNGRLIRVRVPYAFGLICASNAAAVTVSMLPVDSAVVGMAQYNGYAFRDPTTGLYTYVPSAVAPAPALAQTCTGNLLGQARIATLTDNGRSGAVLTLAPGSVVAQPTSAVFMWQRITYSFQLSNYFPGRWALFRQVGNRAQEEIMGPFDGASRFRIYRRGDDTSRTVFSLADTTTVKGIDIVLTGVAQRLTGGYTNVQQSKMVSSVFFKNLRNN
jgi:prepilin-type N-terminal cleavage/methylation domain-containing protein